MTTRDLDNYLTLCIIGALLVIALVPLMVPAPSPRALWSDTYSELAPVQGLGKQRVVIVTEGNWTCLRVLTDGAEIGELVRFNVVTREMRYPGKAPVGWTGGAK